MNGLDKPALDLNIAMLQTLLSSNYVLSIKIRNFHWNVRGPQFQMLHELFGSMYNTLNGQADEIAERIRQLGGRPNGTMAAFIKDSFLKEASNMPPTSSSMLNTLVDDSEKMVAQMRISIPKSEESKDFGTMDLTTKWMEVHEKHLYFLRSHLE